MRIDLPKIGLSGHYKVGVIRASGHYEQLAEFDNLITNAGLDFIAGNSVTGATQYCRAGTGTTPPAAGQTALVSQIGSASPTGTEALAANAELLYTSGTRVYTFAIGAVVGNVAEIGTFSDETGGTMFSRALIRNAGGDPTTITILADEQLVVTFEYRVYVPQSDVTGTVSISVDGVPTDFTYTIRAASFLAGSDGGPWVAYAGMNPQAFEPSYTAAETQTLSAITAYDSHYGSGATSVSIAGYTNGNFYRDHTVTYGLSAANLATGIGKLWFFSNSYAYGGPKFQMSINPKLPKTNTKTLTLTYRVSWGRYAA